MDNKKIIATLISVMFVFWVLGIWVSYNNTASVALQRSKAQDLSYASNAFFVNGESEDSSINLEPVSVGGHAQLEKDYITDTLGRTLYVKSGSKCAGNCLKVWPPYEAKQAVAQGGKLGVTLNEDAKILQYTWNGQLLYYYAEDKNPGDIKGNGVGGVWSVVEE